MSSSSPAIPPLPGPYLILAWGRMGNGLGWSVIAGSNSLGEARNVVRTLREAEPERGYSLVRVMDSVSLLGLMYERKVPRERGDQPGERAHVPRLPTLPDPAQDVGSATRQVPVEAGGGDQLPGDGEAPVGDAEGAVPSVPLPPG